MAKQVFTHNYTGETGGAQILLQAGKDDSELTDVDLARQKLRGHVGDEGDITCLREAMPARPIECVVAGNVQIGGVRRQARTIEFGNAIEAGVSAACRCRCIPIARCFLAGFDAPGTCFYIARRLGGA